MALLSCTYLQSEFEKFTIIWILKDTKKTEKIKGSAFLALKKKDKLNLLCVLLLWGMFASVHKGKSSMRPELGEKNIGVFFVAKKIDKQCIKC